MDRHGKTREGYRLVVPLDAGEVEGFSPHQPVKVVARTLRGRITSAPARFDPEGRGAATLTFPEHPGGLSLLVGPGDAPDDELARLRTLEQRVPHRRWQGGELVLPALRVPAYWWSWWSRWCRPPASSGGAGPVRLPTPG